MFDAPGFGLLSPSKQPLSLRTTQPPTQHPSLLRSPLAPPLSPPSRSPTCACTGGSCRHAIPYECCDSSGPGCPPCGGAAPLLTAAAATAFPPACQPHHMPGSQTPVHRDSSTPSTPASRPLPRQPPWPSWRPLADHRGRAGVQPPPQPPPHAPSIYLSTPRVCPWTQAWARHRASAGRPPAGGHR